MYLQKPLQLILYVLLVLPLAPVVPALSVHRSAAKPYGDMSVHDARNAAPKGFVHVGNLADDTAIDLEIGLRGRDIPGLVERLYEVSTPGSPSYRKHLSKAEAESYAKPTGKTMREVAAWLSYHGVHSKTIGPSGDRLKITVPVSKANKMFQATFSTFRHSETGTESYQALSYSLPAQLKDMIHSVEPTTSFPNPAIPPTVHTFTSRPYSSAPPCDQAITPSCLQQLYGIPTTTDNQSGNYISVAGFLNEFANRQDLGVFLANFRSDLNGATFTDQSIDGGQNPQDSGTAGLEANLDIQYTVGLVNYAPVVFLSSRSSNINGFTDMANYWLAQDSPPSVVSISYGFNEPQVSQQSASNLCNLFAQLGARGTSILISSGDGGVSGSRFSDSCTTFVPTFPASCPYITAVGATGSFPTEVGAGLSAGGFSNYFSQPDYQTSAVNNYLSQESSLYNGLFNSSGRAYPDVSAQGLNILIVGNQTGLGVEGTSASTPIFASVITLLNNLAIQQYNKTFGFLNLLLYQNAGFLNDIVSGNNPGCGTSGFPAAAGWDPVTGLGTPNFQKMAGISL